MSMGWIVLIGILSMWVLRSHFDRLFVGVPRDRRTCGRSVTWTLVIPSELCDVGVRIVSGPLGRGDMGVAFGADPCCNPGGSGLV